MQLLGFSGAVRLMERSLGFKVSYLTVTTLRLHHKQQPVIAEREIIAFRFSEINCEKKIHKFQIAWDTQ